VGNLDASTILDIGAQLLHLRIGTTADISAVSRRGIPRNSI
jgi:hypothetical protein